jgi:hypothetical protein
MALVRFRSNNNSQEAAATMRLYCYVDAAAAYATHPDSKSHTGSAFCLGDPHKTVFHARTMKQTIQGDTDTLVYRIREFRSR